MNGYGLLAVSKSDWIRFGGKFKVNLTAEESNVPFNFLGGWGATQRTELQILSYQTIKSNFLFTKKNYVEISIQGTSC